MTAMAPDVLTSIAAELAAHFHGLFTEAEVTFVVEDSYRELELHCRTPHYLEILLRKDACDRLTQMARYRGAG